METSAVLVRFPVELLQRIDARKETLESQVGWPIARHDVILRLCEMALDTVEGPSTIRTSTTPVVEMPAPTPATRPAVSITPSAVPQTPAQPVAASQASETPAPAIKTTPVKRAGEIPQHIQVIAETRAQYEKLSLAEFSQLLFDRGIYRAKDRKTGEEKPVNRGTLQHWLDEARGAGLL
jgi:hypothetical protein